MQTQILDCIPRPWFASELTDDGRLLTGEDVHFCNQARSARVPVFVDHALSLEVGHIGKTVLRFPG